jgi:hypothetical protein
MAFIHARQGQPLAFKPVATRMNSDNLVAMCEGYLIVCRQMNQPYHKPLVAREAKDMARDIRKRFGTFDESDNQQCATRIRAIMNDPPFFR